MASDCRSGQEESGPTSRLDQSISAVCNDDEFMQELNLDAEGAGSLTTQQLRTLVRGLAHNTHVTKLGLQRQGLRDTGAVMISQVLRHGSVLRSVNLSWNSLSTGGARHLAEALSNARLQELHLSGNQEIGDEGVCALAEGIRDSTALEVLDLSWVGMSDESVQALAGALTGRPLRWLQLMGNKITSHGAMALLQATKEQPLRFLGLAANLVGTERRRLESGIRECSRLMSLDLRRNQIPLLEGGVLADALLENHESLQQVELRINCFGDLVDEEQVVGSLLL